MTGQEDWGSMAGGRDHPLPLAGEIHSLRRKKQIFRAVHFPVEDYAAEITNSKARTEMCTVVAAEPGAQWQGGFGSAVTERQQLRQSGLRMAPLSKLLPMLRRQAWGHICSSRPETVHAIGGRPGGCARSSSNRCAVSPCTTTGGGAGESLLWTTMAGGDVVFLEPFDLGRAPGKGVLLECDYFTTCLVKGMGQWSFRRPETVKICGLVNPAGRG